MGGKHSKKTEKGNDNIGMGILSPAEVKKTVEKARELEESTKRIQADFENARKRWEGEKEKFMENAEAHFVKSFLPLLDSTEAAEKQLIKSPPLHIAKTGEDKDFSTMNALSGIRPFKKQLQSILSSYGLHALESVGQRFDPMLHECIMQGKDEKKSDGIVLEEFQKGYLLKGSVLRHAKVKVNKLK